VSSRKPQEVAICADSAAFGAIDMWAEAQDGSGLHGTSWMVLALPYVDQGPRHSRWNFDDSVAGNRAVAEANIPLFYCPSRRSGVRPEDVPIMFGGWTAGGNDYGGCIGACNGWHDCGAHESWVVGTDRRPEGSCKGAFRINSRTRIHDVTDGTTNTLLLGELQRLNGGTDITTSRDGWAVGGVSTMFSSCSNACDGPNSPHFEELGSAHPGGAHVALVDGSVRYLANEINLSILSALGTMAGDGPSEF
jgi:prepilin-type processing-associated H-X9-DG protein